MKEMILGIDPGTEESAIVLISQTGKILHKEYGDNVCIGDYLETAVDKPTTHLAIEMVASYGMPVGKTVFETCVWIGRFIELWGGRHTKVYRKDVKMHLCGQTKAKDSNIRQALIDMYGPGKDKAIGKKASQGPLYGFKGDLWAALAVAITFRDTKV